MGTTFFTLSDTAHFRAQLALALVQLQRDCDVASIKVPPPPSSVGSSWCPPPSLTPVPPPCPGQALLSVAIDRIVTMAQEVLCVSSEQAHAQQRCERWTQVLTVAIADLKSDAHLSQEDLLLHQVAIMLARVTQVRPKATVGSMDPAGPRRLTDITPGWPRQVRDIAGRWLEMWLEEHLEASASAALPNPPDSAASFAPEPQTPPQQQRMAAVLHLLFAVAKLWPVRELGDTQRQAQGAPCGMRVRAWAYGSLPRATRRPAARYGNSGRRAWKNGSCLSCRSFGCG
jgi:hypothetical protein